MYIYICIICMYVRLDNFYENNNAELLVTHFYNDIQIFHYNPSPI